MEILRWIARPLPSVLKQMTPERIYLDPHPGDMVKISQGLTDQQKRDIAEWVGGRKLGAAESGDAKKMTNVCASNPPIRDLTSKPSWNGWSADLSNTRFQPAKAANLSAAQVSRLHLKWAFGLPAAASVYGQPTIVDGRVFVSSDAGFVYALDAESGCVHWSFQAQTGVRSAITVGKMKPSGGVARNGMRPFSGTFTGISTPWMRPTANYCGSTSSTRIRFPALRAAHVSTTAVYMFR